jgi:hypothetical protein
MTQASRAHLLQGSVKLLCGEIKELLRLVAVCRKKTLRHLHTVDR